MIKYSFWVLLIGLTSCGIYRQNVVNSPLLQQKGQVQIGGHKSFNGLEGQAAVAVTKNIGLLASYNNMGEDRDVYSAINYEIKKHHFKEVGAGIFNRTESDWIWELYALAGKGMYSRFWKGANTAGSTYETNQKVEYSRFGIQADFGRKENKLEFALTPRLLWVNYYKIDDDSRTDYKDIANSYVYAEGAFTLRYHILKFLMISSQVGVTFPLKNYGYNHYFEFSPFNASAGLIFNLNLLKSKE
ncbi:hypothetical protein I5M27_12170 [Adhaeribacter sp. BT258]|uniref:Outer membrane protein beta-barrel domain-containing protein n=1 Tax=Adhaeribacter terrigena TaxID=2793070 RepID=A0ABS1C3L0_9BACT|nr:hypothetical protein [Adhaeribacter terrigena]MBK0403747.1 hypothetical protein [Adhaeribacter terrigena]